MTEVFNKISEKEKRRRLRNNMPKAETLLWNRIRRKQIANTKFRRQYSVGHFVLDFYSPELKLAIEVDGPTHQGAEAQQRDRDRQSFIETFGIQFLRITNQDIESDQSFV